MENKRKRMEELVARLNRAGRAYYQESRELISNQEYDKLYDELQRLETETGIVLANSPTVHVGYEVISSLPKEQHPSPMLSLDKTKEVGALESWLGDKEGLLSWKLDGLTDRAVRIRTVNFLKRSPGVTASQVKSLPAMRGCSIISLCRSRRRMSW